MKEHKIIHTDKGSVVVDENAVIELGNWYVSHADKSCKIIQSSEKIFENPKTLGLEKSIHNAQHFKITHTIAPLQLEGVPTLEIPVAKRLSAEEIIEPFLEEMGGNVSYRVAADSDIITAMKTYESQNIKSISDEEMLAKIEDAIRVGAVVKYAAMNVLEIFKAFQSLQGRRYTEEELDGAYLQGCKDMNEFRNKDNGSTFFAATKSKEYIQSLQPQPKSVTLSDTGEVIKFNY